MSFEILTIEPFDKQLKRLAKKYPSIKKDLIELIESLEDEPKQGTSIGKNCYKVRMSISSKGKGKSGGARLITYLRIVKEQLILVAIYDKSEQSSISEKDILKLIALVEG